MKAELSDHHRHQQVWFLVQEHFISDVVQVQFNCKLFHAGCGHDPETEVDGASRNHIRLGKSAAEVTEVLDLIFKLDLFVLSVGGYHAWQDDVEILSRQSEVQGRRQRSLVIPTAVGVDVKVRLEKGVHRLHADKCLERVKVSVVLERHCRESNIVVVADTLVEEETLYTDLNRVERHYCSNRSNHVELPELVKEVDASVGLYNRSVHSVGKSNCDSFLVTCLNEPDHWSFEEANEAARKLRPNVAVEVHLNVLLTNHELNIHSGD